MNLLYYMINSNKMITNNKKMIKIKNQMILGIKKILILTMIWIKSTNKNKNLMKKIHHKIWVIKINIKLKINNKKIKMMTRGLKILKIMKKIILIKMINIKLKINYKKIYKLMTTRVLKISMMTVRMIRIILFKMINSKN